MRIIAGTFKGKSIPAATNHNVRPTSDRTKEAIFSYLDARYVWKGHTVLDLFAGTGNLGLEALSRGVESVDFVETETDVVKRLHSTCHSFGVESQVRIHHVDVATFLEQSSQASHIRAYDTQAYDFILADPPYDWSHLPELPSIILDGNLLLDDGTFILEHDKRHSFDTHPKCVRSKPYGRTIVSIFEP
ncbi:MAG: 16S rRNA (guanine(966)-N(2))-methyltransferase RsmD [Balneolaceae bacterium]|nr:16S rRNA (guanine(966)-N(2))-methyltransferase RsmD [Balneolaceae bacterium]